MKQRIVFALLMGIITTAIISFTLIVLNIGFSDIFFKVWFKSWLLAYLVAIPIILLVGPIIQKLVNIMFSTK